jgi:hypothetical protein
MFSEIKMANKNLWDFLQGGQGAKIFDWIIENKPVDWKKIGIYSALVVGCVFGVIGLYHMGELQNKIDAQMYGKSSELVIKSADTVPYTKN